MSVPIIPKGTPVRWPNGVEGTVQAVDHSDHTIMDECGGWHDPLDVDVIEHSTPPIKRVRVNDIFDNGGRFL